jgi:CO/xanthine dehydrogenase Mo-binding subunit
MGTAVKFAAEDLAEQIRKAAAEAMGCDPDNVTLEDGWAEAGDQRMDYGAVVRTYFAFRQSASSCAPPTPT